MGSRKRVAFCVIGVIALVVAIVLTNISAGLDPFYMEWNVYDSIAATLFPVGYYFCIQGSYWWAKEKGRSGWWSLMGLIAPFGYIVLMNLKNRRITVAMEALKNGYAETHGTTNSLVINYCPTCGIKITAEMNYCPKCGRELR